MSRVDVKAISVVVGFLEPLLARGVADALRSDRRLRATVSESVGGAFESEVFRESPRVVVCGERVGYAQLTRLRSPSLAPEILVVARDRAELVGPLLLHAGISCLAGGVSSEGLLMSVHRAASGRPTFCCLEDEQRLECAYPAGLADLTNREIEVLGCLSEGYTNPEIGAALQISVGTARTHVARILRKLGRSSRRELIGMRVIRPGAGG
jgi:DNA-binding NarL/FixJ family response regulator